MACHRWVIVLAAGDGARVRDLTRDCIGTALPKQFWSPGDTGPLIGWALRRASRLTSASRIVTVVAAQHRKWWSTSLSGETLSRAVVQPENRGTAAGVLFPLLGVLRRDWDPRVAILPADHAVDDEGIFTRTLERAFDLLERGRRVILLGMVPDRPDPSYGWIVSGRADEDGTRPILSFREKPGLSLARDLFLEGAHWSSFILVAQARALLSMYETIAPALIRSLARVAPTAPSTHPTGRPDTLEQVYARLPRLDLSRDMLERSATRLRMLAVPPCGWTDLGTPDRIERWKRDHRTGRFQPVGAHVSRSRPNGREAAVQTGGRVS